MDDRELLEGLKEARELMAEKLPVIISWTALKAINEAIRRMSEKRTEVA